MSGPGVPQPLRKSISASKSRIALRFLRNDKARYSKSEMEREPIAIPQAKVEQQRKSMVNRRYVAMMRNPMKRTLESSSSELITRSSLSDSNERLNAWLRRKRTSWLERETGAQTTFKEQGSSKKKRSARGSIPGFRYHRNGEMRSHAADVPHEHYSISDDDIASKFDFGSFSQSPRSTLTSLELQFQTSDGAILESDGGRKKLFKHSVRNPFLSLDVPVMKPIKLPFDFQAGLSAKQLHERSMVLELQKIEEQRRSDESKRRATAYKEYAKGVYNCHKENYFIVPGQSASRGDFDTLV